MSAAFPSRKPIAAGNWKLHKTADEAEQFCRELTAGLGPADAASIEIIIAPTAIALERTRASLSRADGIAVAAQNCHYENQGAFTGEISPLLIRDLGCTHVILGHSERRAIFGESDDIIRRKIGAVLKAALVPIFCVGETLEEREGGRVREVLERQVVYGLEGIDLRGPGDLVIAYEPVWAIGTGRTASAADAQEAHEFIRNLARNLYGSEIAGGLRILYGGSVKPGNTAELTSRPDVDGALVGGASLEAESFLNIIGNMRGAAVPA